MRVGDREALDSIAGNSCGVSFRNAVLFDIVQRYIPGSDLAFKGVCPIVGLAQFDLGFSISVVGQDHLDSRIFRTHAVSVVIVIPDLDYRDLDIAFVERVRNGKPFRDTSGDLCLIVRDRILGDGVSDLLTVRVLRQVLKLALPLISFRKSKRNLFGSRFNYSSVSTQADRYRIRALSCRVFIVVPNLLDGNIDRFRRVSIGDVEPVLYASDNLELIGSRAIFTGDHIIRFFLNDILDRLAVFVLRNIRKLARPFVDRGDFLGVDLILSVKNADNYGFRTDAVLIISVIPVLGDTNVNRLRLVRVGDRKAILNTAADLGIVPIRNILGDFVYKSCSAGTLRQILEFCGPLSAFVQFRRGDFLFVLQKSDRYRLRTNAVAVIIIFPDLRDIDSNLLRRMGVGDNEIRFTVFVSRCFPCIGSCTVRSGDHIIRYFLDRVNDLLTVAADLQLLEDCRPLIFR